MLDFLQKPKITKENFWALLIEPEWISSSIWQITDGKVEIISTSTATRWEDDLIEPIDASLSSCTQNLPDDVPDPSKTVFGVPNSWIDGGNIKEEYLEKLKKICKDLSLVPSGFVVLSEAISHYIKQEEEVPLSGVVVGISTEALDISIFNSGKLLGTTSVLRSVSVEEDMVEGISRLSGELENLPSRIILFNQKEQELEEIKSSLDSADWNKIGNSKFIHAPKVEILDPNKKILAVALAGGSELGEVSGIIESLPQNINSVSEPEVDTKTEELPIEEVANFEEPDEVTAEDLGFSVKTPDETSSVSTFIPNLPKKLSFPVLPKMPQLNFKKPNFNFSFSLGSKPLIMGGSLILTLVIVGFALWWFLPKASVTIFVSPKKLEESTTLELDSDIQGEQVEVSVSGEKTKPTTGTKTVGEKAKGSAKIQNGTDFPINLPIGTVLLSSTDLKFVTTKAASISGALSPSTPGTTTVDIEAGNIGSEYNLPKDEVFKVGNYPKSEVDGTSTDQLAGGSSRQISSVAEDDRKKILNELTDELLEEAKTKLSEKINSDMLLVDASFNIETLEENYSNKVGDEATNLKLTLSLKVTSSAVSKTALSEIAKRSLDVKIPTGFILRDDQITYRFVASDTDGKFDVSISANLLPSIDTTIVAKQIAGKYPNHAESFLGSIPGFVNAEIRLKPPLTSKLGTLPHISKNIEVTITAEK